MIRLLLCLVFLAGVGFAAAWMADHPGNVVVHWFDYRIDTSIAFLALIALGVAGICMYIAMLFFYLFSAPRRFRERLRLKHHQQGLAELTYGVASLAAADDVSASRHVRKAEKLLGTTPLGLLISAQIAKIRGDDETARLLLTQMLNHKETKQMAARLLSPPRSDSRQLPAWRKTLQRLWEYLKLW